MEKVRVIIKRPDEEFGHVTNISPSLGNLQRNVGGYVEAVKLFDDAWILCDEEGRLKGKEYNCTIAGVDFVGDIILIGVKGEEFADLVLSFADWKEYVLGKPEPDCFMEIVYAAGAPEDFEPDEEDR